MLLKLKKNILKCKFLVIATHKHVICRRKNGIEKSYRLITKYNFLCVISIALSRKWYCLIVKILKYEKNWNLKIANKRNIKNRKKIFFKSMKSLSKTSWEKG